MIEAWTKRDMLDVTKALNSAQKILSAFERSMTYIELIRRFYKSSDKDQFELQLPEEPLYIKGDKSIYNLLFWDLYFYCLEVNGSVTTKIEVKTDPQTTMNISMANMKKNLDKLTVISETADFLGVKLHKTDSSVLLAFPS